MLLTSYEKKLPRLRKKTYSLESFINNEDMLSPERRLLCSVICQAFRDTKSKNKKRREEAVKWLHGPIAHQYLQLLGYEHVSLPELLNEQSKTLKN